MTKDSQHINVIKASVISGIVEVSLTHPIDVLKTLKQENLSINKMSISKLYSGYIPRIIGIVPMRCIFWSSQFYYLDILNRSKSSSQYNPIFAGVFAGITQTIIDTPIENNKMKLINNTFNGFNKFNDSHHHFIKSYYRGFIPHLARNTIFASSVCYFNYLKNNDKKINKQFGYFIYPAIGGVIGAVISQPLDYIKTIKQSGLKNVSIPQIGINSIYNYYRGGGMRAMMAFINMSIGGFIFNIMV